MIVKRILNDDDIKMIIASYFRAMPADVSIEIKTKAVGYGQAEHDEQYIEIVVEQGQTIDD